jgi:hypothetical protein|tara:strand:+ start:478 stop:741 length:264 start_codon:yes stop_codon:yes gene_type:complete
MDTNNLEVMKSVVTSYGWAKSKTHSPIDDEKVPAQICTDFDDDCNSFSPGLETKQATHWNCWEHQPECGICPFALQDVTQHIENNSL